MADQERKTMSASEYRLRLYAAVMVRVLPKAAAEALIGAVALACICSFMFGSFQGLALVPPAGFAMMHMGSTWWRAHRVTVDRIERDIAEAARMQERDMA